VPEAPSNLNHTLSHPKSLRNHICLPRNTLVTTALSLIIGSTVLAAETGPFAVSKNIVISSLPYTVSGPGTYVLKGDLTFPAPQGAGVAAINILTTLSGPVVLDLGGHAIIGPGGANQNFGVSIEGSPNPTENKCPIAIKNGTIQNFEIGVDAEQGNLASTKKITVTNVNFSTVTTIYGTYGVKFLQVSDSNVSNCSFSGAEYGILDGASGGNNRYLNNSFTNNGAIAISPGDPLSTYVIDCEVSAPVQ
jgi:hypothetical protein